MKAAVLGIGTELVDGQIVNKNASWISQKLKAMGLTTTVHLVVPDEKSLMMEGIEFCAAKADLIFVTGGLGPTSDDFTRDIVAEWSQKPLVFHAPSWQHVQDRLTSRGYTVKEIQKQQCYFPKDALVLTNNFGTANGFQLQINGKEVFVLPGPPREIEAIWKDSIQSWLAQNTKHLDSYLTRKWDTMGVGESDIAIIVENILTGISADKGYRVHLPYVEVKLSYFKSKEEEMLPLVDKLTDALKFCTITRDGIDTADVFVALLKKIPSVAFLDTVTGPFLIARLLPFLREYQTNNQWMFANEVSLAVNAELVLTLVQIEENLCEATLKIGNRIFAESLSSPHKTANMKERRMQYFAESALIFWTKTLMNL